MRELILKYFDPTMELDNASKLAMAFAWLEQAEKENNNLVFQYEKLHIKNLELNLVVKNKGAERTHPDDDVINEDHFVVKWKTKASLPEDTVQREAFLSAPSSVNEDTELTTALQWLEELNEENASLVVDNRRLLYKNLELVSIMNGEASPSSDTQSDISNGDHLSFGWSSSTGDSKPFVNSSDGSLAVKWRLGGLLLTVPIPSSLVEIKPWIDKYLDDKIALTPSAEKTAKSALYKNVTLVYQALLLLGTRRDMFVHGGLNERKYFEEKLDELGLRHASSKGQTGSARANAEYKIMWQGATLILDQALKRGVSRDKRDTLRIYFAYDTKSRKIVVGHLPTHLSNSMS